jgi:hypothetical protein
MVRRSLFLAALLTLPAAASAQLCLGAPSLAVSRLNLNGGAEFADGVKAFGGGLTVGGSRGFVSAGAARLSYDDLDVGATAVTGSAGLSFAPAPQSAVQVCPLVSTTIGIGPDGAVSDGFDLYDITTRTLSVAGGVAIGGAVEVSPGLRVVPHVSLAVQYLRLTLSDDVDSFTDSDTGGALGGGISLLLGDVFAIRPAVSVPLGFEGSDPVFSLGFTVGFRR